MLAGCNVYPSYGASRGATKQGQETFKLYSGMMTTGIIVGGLVGLLILWTIIRYRRRSDEMPRQFHENIPIEILYTVIPVIIVAVLFFFTVLTENNVDAIHRSTPPHRHRKAGGRHHGDRLPVGLAVRLPRPQRGGGRRDHQRARQPRAADGRPGGPDRPDHPGVRRRHPRLLRAGLQLQPLRPARGDQLLRPRRAPHRDLHGQCTQICGLYHSEMLFTVRAVSPAAFARGPAARRSSGHTLPRSGSSAQDNPPIDTHVTNGSGYYDTLVRQREINDDDDRTP